MNRTLLTAAYDASQWWSRCALQSLLLAFALVACGSIPSTALAPSEVESEVPEEATAASTSIADLRRGLRQAALRPPVKCGAVLAHVPWSPALAAPYIGATPHLSAGLAIPLRC
ncbi:MAG: hypothetical protein JNL18_05440 [Planctomycetaceae bacterium]|nr:hypothetical protein [Planctomycetaceae bacterium]